MGEPEIILSITDRASFKTPKGSEWHDFEGYEVVTSKQTILFGIDNHSDCCESWGHLSTEDNLDEFVGATLLGITRTDEALNTEFAKKVNGEYGLDDGGAIFITLETSKGNLQFVVYNSQNGYYGHSVELVSTQLSFEDGV